MPWIQQGGGGGRLPPDATSSLAAPGALRAMASSSGLRHAPSTDMANNFGSNIRRTLIVVSASDRHGTPWDAEIFRGPSTCGPRRRQRDLGVQPATPMCLDISLMCRLLV